MSENTQVVTQNTGAVVQKPKTFDMALMEKLDSVNDALPKDFNKQRFVQNTLALIHDNPKLMEYKQSEIMSGLMKGATLGLDFFNKEAYLVPQRNLQRSILSVQSKIFMQNSFVKVMSLRRLLKTENRESTSNQRLLMMERLSEHLQFACLQTAV